MRKSLLIMWFISLTVLTAGTVFYPNSPAFWLASNTSTMQVIRGFLAALLLVQIFTQPPRNVWFRLFAGTTALAVATWSIQALLGFDIKLLDALAFVGASTAIGLTALERSIIEESSRRMEAQAARP